MEHHLDAARAPSPVAEEADEDDDSSSTYVRTVKRIIQDPPAPRSALPSDLSLGRNRFRRPLNRDSGLEMISGAQMSADNRSTSIISEQIGQSQVETSFMDPEMSSTDNQAFVFELPSADDHNKPPPFARRYFMQQNYDFNDQLDRYSVDNMSAVDSACEGGGAGGSGGSEPDLNTKWSWRDLKREFKLSHSESLFHLYQAKLQHSFFVALLILNIIFNFGAVISYSIGKYHEMNLCKYNSPII